MCARHLWGCAPCANRPDTDLRGKRKPKVAPTVVDVPREQHTETMAVDSERNQRESERNQILLEQLDVQKRHLAEQLDVQKRNDRQLAAIRGVLEISDHSSDDEEKLKRRAKRKLNETADKASTAVYESVANAGKYSPQRDGEIPVVFGRRVEACVDVGMKDAVKGRAYKKTSDKINEKLELPTCATPKQSIDAVGNMKSLLKASAETKGRLRHERGELMRKLQTERDANGSLESTLEDMRAGAGGSGTHTAGHDGARDRTVIDTLLKEFHVDKQGCKCSGEEIQVYGAVTKRLIELRQRSG